MFWLTARIALFTIISWSAFATYSTPDRLNWLVAVLFPIGLGAGFLMWTTGYGWRQDVDLSEPLSLTKPFWPIYSYPTRVAAIVAGASVFGGGIAIATELVVGRGIAPTPTTTFASGISIAVAIWMTGRLVDKNYKK